MTDYGRGPGSEPWYPDDPLYGDQEWSGGYDGTVTPQGQPGSWDQYGGQQEQHYPPQQQPRQPYYPDQYPEQQYPQQQYPQQGGWDANGQYYGADPYQQQHQPSGQYATGQQYQDPYATQQHQQYAPSPEPPQQHQPRQPSRSGAPHQEPGPDPETGWDPGPDQGVRDFFHRDEYDDDPGDEPPRRSGRRGDRPKRRRGGLGCLAAAVLVVGGVGGIGFYGYAFYQDRFGPAPDFAGDGTGEIQVEIPSGSSVSQIGNILKELGVVKSHDAFVAAAGADGQSIQAGVYVLRGQMSAEAAVELLLDPSAVSALTIPEGLRATQVYATIDTYLGLAEGATEEVAGSADIGLPEWAEGDPEGFLFPTRYDIASDTAPEDVLTQMVDRAESEFDEIGLEEEAARLGRSPREVLVIASLIQAEAQADEEFGKVSRVIHNRLDIDMMLQFDSTINYAMGRSTLDTSIADTQVDSPYNTYREYGLPPGPIDNPGHQAIEAALNPTDGDWLYFVTVRPGDTRFTADSDEHDRNVADFNAAQEEAREEEGGDG
ncbi:endolytic transglycosylase MltG [Streptomyces sp. NBC_01803]|uniref:endolytic transglycosylase MltG n=1 Tax=Streptomyces sp. NBC_01803 TaxID=2975946 RepID=UPI002DDB29FB|nr:endolytic transglycosylase MltG [Streptomyces sp. NBC_01803]WSA47165.1 endolytic transglycosylase MltG [Streptomyces sp. NBC_01803]